MLVSWYGIYFAAGTALLVSSPSCLFHPTMASASRLRAILSFAFSSNGLPNGEQEFFEELMAHRPQLVNLYDVGPRNPQEQRELESGALVLCAYNLRALTVDARENHD